MFKILYKNICIKYKKYQQNIKFVNMNFINVVNINNVT